MNLLCVPSTPVVPGTIPKSPSHHRAEPGVAWAEIAGPTELPAFVDEWQELANRALEPNPFYEPWMLLPALDTFGRRSSLQHVFIRQSPSNPKHAPRLIGYFPLEIQRRLKGIPWRHVSLWQHMHCFLCTPLLDREHAGPALDTFLDWCGRSRDASVAAFPLVHGEGPFHQVLQDILHKRQSTSYQDVCFGRAILRRDRDGEAYLQGTLSTGNRKELRRQRRRLGELGLVETRLLEDEGDPDRWVEDFLALEASGWKGTHQTAMASDENQTEWFRRVLRAGHRVGKVQMLGIFLDDRPIAMKCNFLSGSGSFAFKIAFDESHARYSPGVQLEIDNILELHRRPDLQWMDSCAASRHFMINRLWRDRRMMQSLFISAGSAASDFLIGLLPVGRVVRHHLRRLMGKS